MRAFELCSFESPRSVGLKARFQNVWAPRRMLFPSTLLPKPLLAELGEVNNSSRKQYAWF
jgi:hypothetical protein